MNRKTLRELLEGSVQGKEDAFEELYQRYKEYVVHTAQSLIGKYRSHHQADEVVQEIWKDFWESKLEKFQGEADKAFLGWLYRVVQNHLLDQIRRAKRQPESLPRKRWMSCALCRPGGRPSRRNCRKRRLSGQERL